MDNSPRGTVNQVALPHYLVRDAAVCVCGLTRLRRVEMTGVVSLAHEVRGLLTQLGVSPSVYVDGDLGVRTPITGEVIGQLPRSSAEAAAETIEAAHTSFMEWRIVPAPRRGELIRLLAEELRSELPSLGRLI